MFFTVRSFAGVLMMIFSCLVFVVENSEASVGKAGLWQLPEPTTSRGLRKIDEKYFEHTSYTSASQLIMFNMLF